MLISWRVISKSLLHQMISIGLEAKLCWEFCHKSRRFCSKDFVRSLSSTDPSLQGETDGKIGDEGLGIASLG